MVLVIKMIKAPKKQLTKNQKMINPYQKPRPNQRNQRKRTIILITTYNQPRQTLKIKIHKKRKQLKKPTLKRTPIPKRVEMIKMKMTKTSQVLR